MTEKEIIVANLKSHLFINQAEAKARREYTFNTQFSLEACVLERANLALAEKIKELEIKQNPPSPPEDRIIREGLVPNKPPKRK